MSVTLQKCNYALPYAPICCCLPKWLLLTNGFTVPILHSGTLQGITQAPPYSIHTPKVKYGVHDHSTAFHLYVKEQPLLTVYQSSR